MSEARNNSARQQTQRAHKGAASATPAAATAESSGNPLSSVKAQYRLELASLKELFPDWDEDSLITSLQEVQFDMDAVIERISQGHAGMWHEVKKEHAKDKGVASPPPTSSPGPAAKTNGEGFAGAPGRGGVAARGAMRGGRGGAMAGRGGRGGARGGRGGSVAGGRGTKPKPEEGSPDGPVDGVPVAAPAAQAGWGDAGPDDTPAEVSGGWGDEPAAETHKTNGWGEPISAPPAPAPVPAPAHPQTVSKPADKKATPAKPSSRPAQSASQAAPSASSAAEKPKPTSWASIVKPAPPPESPKPVPQPAPQKQVKPAGSPAKAPAPPAGEAAVTPAAAKPAADVEAKRPPPGLKQPGPAAAPAKPAPAPVAPAPAPQVLPTSQPANRKTLQQDAAVVMPPDMTEMANKFASLGVKFGTVDPYDAPKKPVSAAVGSPVSPGNVAGQPVGSPVAAAPRKSAPTPPPRAPSPQKAAVAEAQLALPAVAEVKKEAPSAAPAVQEPESVPKPVVEEHAPPSQPVAAITATTPISQLLSTTASPQVVVSQPTTAVSAPAATATVPGAAPRQPGAAAPAPWGENPAGSALPSWQAFQGMGWGDYSALYGGLGQQGVEPGRGLMGYYDPQSVYSAQAGVAGFGPTTSGTAGAQSSTAREGLKFGAGPVQDIPSATPIASAQAAASSTPATASQGGSSGPGTQAGYPNLGMPYAAYYPYGYPMSQFPAAPQYGAGAPQGYGRNVYPAAMYGPSLGQVPQQAGGQTGGSGGPSPSAGHAGLPQQQQVSQHGMPKAQQQQSSQYGYGGNLFPYGTQDAHTGGLASTNVGGLSEFGKTVYGMGMPAGFAGFSGSLQEGSVPMGPKQGGGIGGQGYGKSYDSHKAAQSGYPLQAGSQGSQQQSVNQAYFASGANQYAPQYQGYGHQSGGYGGRGAQGYWGQS